MLINPSARCHTDMPSLPLILDSVRQEACFGPHYVRLKATLAISPLEYLSPG